MLQRVLIGAWLLLTCGSQAAALKLDSLTLGSRTYTNVTILGANASDLYFSHAQGMANAKLKLAPPALQKRFDFDPKTAAEAERRQAEEDAAFLQSIASNTVMRLEETARAAQRAARTSEASLADPVSDSSLLGKPGPSLQLEKWLEPKPELQEKFVLLCFWEPWSLPCRKCIPQLNELHQALAAQLTVVGVSSAPEAELEELAEPKPAFPRALDTAAKLRAAAGATSVPYCLVLDPKGIVRFQGHPGALDAAKLEKLITSAAEQSQP